MTLFLVDAIVIPALCCVDPLLSILNYGGVYSMRNDLWRVVWKLYLGLRNEFCFLETNNSRYLWKLKEVGISGIQKESCILHSRFPAYNENGVRLTPNSAGDNIR